MRQGIRNTELINYVKSTIVLLLVALLIGVIIIATAVITPYLNAKAAENRGKRAERQVEINWRIWINLPNR